MSDQPSGHDFWATRPRRDEPPKEKTPEGAAEPVYTGGDFEGLGSQLAAAAKAAARRAVGGKRTGAEIQSKGEGATAEDFLKARPRVEGK